MLYRMMYERTKKKFHLNFALRAPYISDSINLSRITQIKISLYSWKVRCYYWANRMKKITINNRKKKRNNICSFFSSIISISQKNKCFQDEMTSTKIKVYYHITHMFLCHNYTILKRTLSFNSVIHN